MKGDTEIQDELWVSDPIPLSRILRGVCSRHHCTVALILYAEALTLGEHMLESIPNLRKDSRDTA